MIWKSCLCLLLYNFVIFWENKNFIWKRKKTCILLVYKLLVFSQLVNKIRFFGWELLVGLWTNMDTWGAVSITQNLKNN